MNKYILYWLMVGIATTMMAFSKAEDNSTVHFFLLMVPESKIESLRRRVPRQEEGAAGALGAIAEAAGPAANVGQILQGVLGGDLRPIFAGSTAFIPDGDFREGVTEILQQTVAPAIQRILMEFNKNVQRHFNSTSTTPAPTPPSQNQQFNPNNPNYNNFNNQYPPVNQQPINQFQPNYNQFQQPSNQQFGGAIGGAGTVGGGIGGGGSIVPGNFNGQYNQLQNYPPNPPYQQPPYTNQLQQPPSSNYQNNQLNQFPPPPQNTNFPPNYNQYQQGAINSPSVNPNINPNYQASPAQVQPAAQQPSFSSQIYNPPPVPPQQSTFTQQFKPPPQSFPQPANSNPLPSNYLNDIK